MNDEEIHRAKSGRDPSTGASVSMKVGCASPSQYSDVFTNLEVLRIPYYWDLMDASSSRHDQLLTLFLAHSLEK